MKHITPLLVVSALAAAGFINASHAAVVIEPNGKLSTNFSAATAVSTSTTAGSGTLLAPGLTFGAPSVFGGEAYTYTYTPGSDADNTVFSPGGTLNGNAGLFASGLTGGAAGIYNVYHVFPESTNASGQPTLYDIQVNGGSTGVNILLGSQNQNINDNTTGQPDGVGIGLWELIGQATVNDPSDTLTVTVDTTTTGFVGARTAGVLFEYVGPVPEPSGALLSIIGLLALGLRRRR